MSRHREKRRVLQQLRARLRDWVALGREEPAADAATDIDGVEFVSYKITSEPMPDPQIDLLPAAVQQQVEEIGPCLRESGGKYIEFLEQLVSRYPTIPKFYNYLTVAYQAAGRHDEADRLIELTCATFPDYVFGFVNYVNNCLHAGDLDAAERAIDRRWALHQFVGHVRLFHVSEVVSYGAMIGLFFALKGEIEQAEEQYNMIKQLSPDHRLVHYLGSIIYPRGLKQMLSKMLSPSDSVRPKRTMAVK